MKLIRTILGFPFILGGILFLLGSLAIFIECWFGTQNSADRVSGISFGIALFAIGVLSCVAGNAILGEDEDWRKLPPTRKQIDFARDLGIKIRKGMTRGELSDAITEITGR